MVARDRIEQHLQGASVPLLGISIDPRIGLRGHDIMLGDPPGDKKACFDHPQPWRALAAEDPTRDPIGTLFSLNTS